MAPRKAGGGPSEKVEARTTNTAVLLADSFTQVGHHDGSLLPLLFCPPHLSLISEHRLLGPWRYGKFSSCAHSIEMSRFPIADHARPFTSLHVPCPYTPSVNILTSQQLGLPSLTHKLLLPAPKQILPASAHSAAHVRYHRHSPPTLYTAALPPNHCGASQDPAASGQHAYDRVYPGVAGTEPH